MSAVPGCPVQVTRSRPSQPGRTPPSPTRSSFGVVRKHSVRPGPTRAQGSADALLRTGPGASRIGEIRLAGGRSLCRRARRARGAGQRPLIGPGKQCQLGWAISARSGPWTKPRPAAVNARLAPRRACLAADWGNWGVPAAAQINGPLVPAPARIRAVRPVIRQSVLPTISGARRCRRRSLWWRRGRRSAARSGRPARE